MSDRRYPLGDLVALVRLSDDEARRSLRINGTRWKLLHADGLNPDQAERFATRAGFHPAEVWPTWHDDELADLSAVCPECGDTFIPNRERRQKFCSRRCGTAEASRRYHRERYAADPDYAEAKRERSRSRYQAVRQDPQAWAREKAAVRIRQRKYRERQRQAIA